MISKLSIFIPLIMILSVDKCYALSSVNLMNEHNTTCQNVTLNDSLIKRFGQNCTSNQCNASCDLCMFVANITQGLIVAENITLNITSEFIEELCFLIGGEIIYEECKVVFTLMQDILNCLTDGFSPSETCQLLNLCPLRKAYANLYIVEIWVYKQFRFIIYTSMVHF